MPRTQRQPRAYVWHMAYRSVTHVAIRVMGLREAERYYRGLFGLEVAFREAETTDGTPRLMASRTGSPNPSYSEG